MPKDAAGKGLKFGPLPGYEGPSPSPSVTPSLSPSPTAVGRAVAGAEETASIRARGARSCWVGAALAARPVWCASSMWLVRPPKRPSRSTTACCAPTRRQRATVDRALRVLMAACERDGLDVPGMTGVFIEGSSLRLRLTNPASPAPEPWVR